MTDQDVQVTPMAIGPYSVSAAAVAAGGAGYAVGNTITLANGVVLTVATVTAGAVATVTVANPGAATTPPANPAAQVSTSGTGTGATFNLTWAAAPIGPLKTGNIGVDNVGNVWALTATGPVFLIALGAVQPVAAQAEVEPATYDD